MDEEVIVSTSCRDCVFATWNGKTQGGCKFDRIDKFEDNGAEILGQDDGKKKYFVIVGRFCNACRDKNWGKANPRKEWKNIVEKRIELKVDIIVKVSGDTNVEDIYTTVISSYDQSIKPNSVVIACDPTYTKSITDVVGMMKNNAKGTWRVESLQVEEAAKFCKTSSFYSVFNSGFKIPHNFISNLNKAVNTDLTRFVAVLPDNNGNGLVVKTGRTLNDLRIKGIETHTEYMIKTYEDLIN